MAWRVVGEVLGPVYGSLCHAVPWILPGLSDLYIPGLFITYVMLKNQKVTKKAQ